MILSCVEPATILPFDIETLRLHCRLDADDDRDDEVLNLYAWAAIRQAEFTANRVFLSSEWEGKIADFHREKEIVIPKSPCTVVKSIIFQDVAGTEQALPNSEYVFTPSSMHWDGGNPYGSVKPITAWPEGVGAIITFVAGWDSDKVPHELVEWTLVTVAGHYEKRESLASATRKVAIPLDRMFWNGLLDAWYLPR
ncbi:MAG: phage head-tail connector protein [Desulfovibrio sp.]|jgi:uncharacterized phiE125 gp8 family phage protein|nr:phage head-tail connector protein [Desulfovibrio sp.]